MSYNLNPCKACWKKYTNGNCNINEVNNCVVSTSAAFSTFDSNNSLRGEPSGKHWHDCAAKMMRAMPDQAGQPRTFCNFQLNMAPVLDRAPHYFPGLLDEAGNPDAALQQCRKDCQGHKFPNTCLQTCQTDYDAVEPYQRTVESDDQGPTYKEEEDSNPLVFWTVFSLVGLMLALVLVLFVRALFSKKIGRV